MVLFLLGAIIPVSVAQNTDMELSKFDFGIDPAKRINAILKDRQGFLWLGAQHNLYRYDGNSVKEFGSDLYDLSSLSHYFIHTICDI